ncbi:hypothetical protein GCK72_003005 [Caenorhabditis remanei]|uniref:Sdz-33 F-box domain-containing protein n=1 Tax=Caenorhabditis remanei TaxID=31234 RepID=A0A6A5HTW6_CAERE|nr:hypothetical protein GCK72_003005 [Caenorhabditis remanei]KAF1771179.1 hypothetical protein GCK72_003005 [Caenorhabditis remanei]
MLFDLQLEFKTLCIRLDGVKYRNLLWNQISRYLGFVECLNISSSFDIDFTLVFTSWPQEIVIMRSAWFTLKSLLACASFIITLYDSYLENKDMDEILKNWKTGGLPNLKRLAIDSLSFKDNGEHILGMNWSELDGMVIKADDGLKMATIQLRPHRIEMSVTPFE